MTFSVAARCEHTGRLGIAVSSSSPAVAARCAYARAGTGVVATQNITDPTLGPKGLDLMALGASATQAVEIIVAATANIHYRQLTMLDKQGRTASFSGQHTLGKYATVEQENVVCAGNLLANTDVPQAMATAFQQSDNNLDLGDRLLIVMQAGLSAGGEAGPVHSAGMLLVDSVSWPVADLRVDWHDDPIGELEKLWSIYKPQLNNYVTRALDPTAAPNYGVPGDE